MFAKDKRMIEIQRNPTRTVKIGTATIGAGHPIAVQSMTATHTQDIDATVAPGERSGRSRRRRRAHRRRQHSRRRGRWPKSAGRPKPTSSSICKRTIAWPTDVAPHVDKVRYNPGHLYHHEREKPWQDKVRYLIVDRRGDNDCAIRIGVNCGSVDPAKQEKYDPARFASRRCSTARWSIASCSTSSASRATASR